MISKVHACASVIWHTLVNDLQQSATEITKIGESNPSLFLMLYTD